MNNGYIITANNTKVIVVTDNNYAKKILDYNSNIKEILTNENIVEAIDNNITYCDETGKILYKEYMKYQNLEKIDRKILLYLIVLLFIYLVSKLTLNIDNSIFINAFFTLSLSSAVLGIPTFRLLKRQMLIEVEKNAYKRDALNRKKEEILERNRILQETGLKERKETKDNYIFDITYRKEFEKIKENINREVNSSYEDASRKAKRKIRVR